MRSLTEVYNQLDSKDAELEKQAAEIIKIGEEEDAAGRIMARGFADELHKLADAYGSGYDPLAAGRAGRKKTPKVAPATDTNAPGQAFGSKTKMNPVTGAHQNPGQPKPPAAPKAKVSFGGGPPPPRPAGSCSNQAVDRFLSGFADELIKVAGPWGAPDALPPPIPRPGGGIVRPPSTGTRGASAPKPPNAFGPTGGFNAAIPTQKLESPAGGAPQQWRPSPGYRPSNAGDPTPGAPKPPGGKRGAGGPGKSDVPWETAPNRVKRIVGEQIYNRNLAANPPAAGGMTTSRKSYKLAPQEIQANKDREVAADAKRRKEQQGRVMNPAERVETQRKVRDAGADSALSGGGARRGDRGAPSQRMR
jgi:hypothetical protein